jgi:hypothetical protein
LPQFLALLAFAVVGILAGLLGFASLIVEQKFAEAATQYILAATVVAAIGFFAWMHRDAIRSIQRLEQQRRKQLAMRKAAPSLDDLDADVDLRTPTPADDRIRPLEISVKPETPPPTSPPTAPDRG